jgi:hypothetical protein
MVRIPGKSALQRYSQWLPEAEMRNVIDTLLAGASEDKAAGEQPLELAEALDLEAYFLDTTCVKLHIHFPVDWVLLRDAARTLMKATILIRKRNLRVRMEEPEEFLKRMNQLCMKMTHARRKKDAKRARKGDCGARGTASGSVGEAMAGNGSYRRGGAANHPADHDGIGAAAAGHPPGA